MFTGKIKIVTIILIALTCGGVCLTAYLANKPADPRFPDGLTHDFGTMISGTQYTHSFRIVNTSDVALQIVSLLTS
jgi:hypothetical protein